MRVRMIAIIASLVALVGCGSIASDVAKQLPTAPDTAAPIIVKFEADATRLGPPNGATLDTMLRWDVTGDSVRCRIDSAPGTAIGNVPSTGSVSVRPGVTTVYTLQCTNALGTVLRNLTILVG